MSFHMSPLLLETAFVLKQRGDVRPASLTRAPPLAEKAESAMLLRSVAQESNNFPILLPRAISD
jgi:hypothetical protein